mgnify:CR=1 FL=1
MEDSVKMNREDNDHDRAYIFLSLSILRRGLEATQQNGLRARRDNGRKM